MYGQQSTLIIIIKYQVTQASESINGEMRAWLKGLVTTAAAELEVRSFFDN
jgi:hypothetical protein